MQQPQDQDENALLHRIQQLQFNSLPEAERLLLPFIHNTFPDLQVQAVELRPQAISLNSFNGFLTLADESRLFFKTHTEQDNIIDEYYNAGMLAQSGYPVVKPLYSSTKAGQHLLIYEVITDPSVFDLSWAIENHTEAQATEADEKSTLNALTRAQNAADDDLLSIYRQTLAPQNATEAARAPVHQLFCHRIVGGRMQRFYGDLEKRWGEDEIMMHLPNGLYPMTRLYHMRWQINDQMYEDTLAGVIRRAVVLLNPAQAGPSVIGHGDAHNGNVFFRKGAQPPALMYFDPAFAGRHHPLLDLTKPLFHNVFAMWMYFPKIKRNQTMISLRRKGETLSIRHNYDLPALRHMFLRSKVERTLIPTLQDLKRQKMLRADWRAYLKAALFCCPFLTLNLADSERFPPEISLLGLAMAMEMGAESAGQRSLIDQTLDEVESAL